MTAALLLASVALLLVGHLFRLLVDVTGSGIFQDVAAAGLPDRLDSGESPEGDRRRKTDGRTTIAR